MHLMTNNFYEAPEQFHIEENAIYVRIGQNFNAIA